MDWLTPSTVATIVSACVVAWLLQLIAYSPISPGPSIFQSDSKSEAPFAKNNVLQTVEKLGEGLLDNPEDSAVDSNGMIYTGTKDGWIKRMHPNGSWEEWKKVGGNPLGLTVSKSGHVIVCDPYQGLLKVSDEEVSIIASEIGGDKISFVDAVVEGSDGSLYFSDASTKFPHSRWALDFVEGVPYGRLLKYDPKTEKTSVLLDGLGFANGVALSPSEDYVAVCETWKFRCIKYWIKGEKLGKTEVLVDNLPGGPDNINLALDGRSYWIAILKTVEKLGEGFLDNPEDSAVDSNGMIYTATKDGWIKRMHPNGSWEEWKNVGGNPLGLTVSKSGHVIVCEPYQGLLKVSDEEVSIIASEIEGDKISFVDAVVEGSDGSLYFSDASTKFPHSRWILDFVEGVPYGRLLKYDPETKKTSVLLDGLGFANGVALSPSEDYVAVCETWKFRCLKYWIKGEKLGKTEVLVDNLPGGPDNINLALDGRSYWIAIIKMRIKGLEFMFKYPIFRHIFARYPTMLDWFGFAKGWAMVAKVGEDGTLIKIFDDSNGKVISVVTSAMELGEYLYLGNLNTNFLGRLNLSKVHE